MYRVVFQYRICSLDYFLDEAKFYELPLMLEACNYTDRTSWEQTRLILAPNLKGNIKNSFPLPWDNTSDNLITEDAPTQDELDALARRAKQMESLIQSQK